jgi:hypothetical protein
VFLNLSIRGARWPRGQCARHAIAETKQRSQWSFIGWVTKIYYHELLRASEGTLSRSSRPHLQSLAPTPVVSRRVDVRQTAGLKNNLYTINVTVCIRHVFHQNMMKNMLYHPHLVWEKGRIKNVFLNLLEKLSNEAI